MRRPQCGQKCLFYDPADADNPSVSSILGYLDAGFSAACVDDLIVAQIDGYMSVITDQVSRLGFSETFHSFACFSLRP